MTVSVKAPTSTTGSIQLNGSDVLTIDSSGNLTAPNNLTVTGTVTQTGGATFNGGISGNVNFDSGTLYVDATNNRVGVGTTTPSNSLHLYGSSSALRVERTGSDSAALITKTTLGHYGIGTGIGTATNCFNIYDYTVGTERMRIDSSGNLKFDSGYGSVATAYGCRAWVNFNGTGTVAIRDSGNVSSITDSGVGDYRVNFSTAMPDTDYAVVGSCQGVSGSDIVDFGSFGYGGAPSVTPTTSQVAVGAFAYSGASVDTPIVSVAVFR